MELPKGWVVIDLPQICNIRTGRKDANHAKTNGAYRFYTCSSIFSLCDTHSFSGKCVIVPGNGDIGLVFYYDGLFEAYQRTYVIEKINILPQFLYYHFLWNWRHINSDKQYGTTVRYVRIGNFENYIANIPPLAEQYRIVKKLDELFSRLDKGVETLKTIKNQLKTYRQAVLKRLYSWEIPSELGVNFNETVEINSLCSSISDGDHQAPPQVNQGIPFLVISNISSGRVDYNSKRFVSEEYFNSLDLKRVPKTGDVLYSVTGSFGIPAIVDSDKAFCVQRHIAMLRPTNVLSKYLFYMLQTPQIYLKAREIATGTAQLTVPIRGLRLLNIPMPGNEEEQAIIVASIESRLSVCDKLEAIVDESLDKAKALRQSILKKAFSGQLVPQNPNDEPAEKLLERIKAERNAEEKTKTTRRI